jgi:hypothetical protein
VVEDEDAVRAQRRPDESFRRRIVDLADFPIVVEVPHGRGVANQRKAFAIE